MPKVPRGAMIDERLFRRDDGRICLLSFEAGPNAPRPSVQEFDDKARPCDKPVSLIFTRCEQVTFGARELKVPMVPTCLSCLANT